MASYICTVAPPRAPATLVIPTYADHDHTHEFQVTLAPLVTVPPSVVSLVNCSNVTNESNCSNASSGLDALQGWDADNATNASTHTTTSTSYTSTSTSSTSTTSTGAAVAAPLGNVCSDPHWQHVRRHVTVASVPWALLTLGGLCAVVLAPERTANARTRLARYEYGLASTGGGPAFAILTVHFLQCSSFMLRAANWSVDPVYYALELIGTLLIVIDVLVGWAYRLTCGLPAVLRAAFGRLLLDVFVASAVVAVATSAEGYGQTWFSFSFLAAFRMGRLVRYLEQSASGWRIVICFYVMEMLLFTYGFACSIMTLEFLLQPDGGSVQGDLEIEWEVTSSVVFVLDTLLTLGGSSITPETVIGRLLTMAMIPAGLYMMTSKVAPLAWRLLLGSMSDSASYQPRKDGVGHILVVGTPTASALWDFLLEVYHLNHYSSIAAFNKLSPDVVLLIPDPNILSHLRKYLGGGEALLFRDKVWLLKGDAFLAKDLVRAALPDAKQVVVLPNMVVPDCDADDMANMMRTLAIRTACPKLRITCMLHGAEQDADALGLTANNCAFVSIDAFRYSLLAKGCLTRGAIAYICNLCRTFDEGNLIQKKRWQIEYECSLGYELYEMPLSHAYSGCPFSDAVQDVLARSEDGDVQLIGIVETIPYYGERIVRLHPGTDFIISWDDHVRVSGIFVAPDLASIHQCHEGQSLTVVDADRLTKLRQANIAQKQRSKDRPSQISEGPVYVSAQQSMVGRMKDPPHWWDTQGRTADAFMQHNPQMMAFKGYESSLNDIRHRLLVRGLPVDLISNITQVAEPDAVGEEGQARGPVIRKRGNLKGKRKGFSESLGTSELARHWEIQEAVDKHLERLPAPPSRLLKEGGHIVLTIVSDVTGSGEQTPGIVELGATTGIGNFMQLLRDVRTKGHLGESPAVVVLAMELPGDWYSVVDLDRIYFVLGSPLLVDDLNRAGFQKASSIVVARRHALNRANASKVTDARMILVTTLIEANLPSDSQIPIISDHAYNATVGFLPLGGMHSSEAKALSGLTQSAPPRPAGQNAVLSALFEPPGEPVLSLAAQEDYELLDACDYVRNPRFMKGNAFVNSAMTFLVANSVYNSSLVPLISSLIQAPMMVVAVPAEWAGCRYADFQAWLLTERNVLALGIYRSSHNAADCSGVPTYYMFTAPPAYRTYMNRTDNVLCLCPQAS